MVWPTDEAPPDTTEVLPSDKLRRTPTGQGQQPAAVHTKVSLHIGDIGAAGRVLGEDDAADSGGRYNRATCLVPQLTPGTHTVELAVHTTSARMWW